MSETLILEEDLKVTLGSKIHDAWDLVSTNAFLEWSNDFFRLPYPCMHVLMRADFSLAKAISGSRRVAMYASAMRQLPEMVRIS